MGANFYIFGVLYNVHWTLWPSRNYYIVFESILFLSSLALLLKFMRVFNYCNINHGTLITFGYWGSYAGTIYRSRPR